MRRPRDFSFSQGQSKQLLMTWWRCCGAGHERCGLVRAERALHDHGSPISCGLWGSIKAGHAPFTPGADCNSHPSEQNRRGICYPLNQSLPLRQPMELQGKVCGGTPLAQGPSMHQTPTPAKPGSVCHPQPRGTQKLQRSSPQTALLVPALPKNSLVENGRK